MTCIVTVNHDNEALTFSSMISLYLAGK